VETTTDTYLHLRTLIEGSKANKIPSVPSQKIADELLVVYKSWLAMQGAIEGALNSGEYKNALTVSQVADMSRVILAEMDKAAYEYEKMANYAYAIVPAHLINIAGSQRKLFQKMSKEGSLALFGEDAAVNMAKLSDTAKLFHDRHWELVRGAPATDKYPAMPKTEKVCVIQQMKVVDDLFTELEIAAFKVANGSKKDVETLISVNPPAFEAMDKAVKMYTAFAAPTDETKYKDYTTETGSKQFQYVEEKLTAAEEMCTSITDNLEVSVEEWKAVILEIGNFRALIQDAATQSLLNTWQNSQSSGVNATSVSTHLTKSIDAMYTSLKKLTYGKGGSYNIPPPMTQLMLKGWFAAEDDFASYKELLQASRRLQANESTVSTSSDDMVADVEALLAMYSTAAKESKGEEVPVLRLDVASREVMLAHKIVKLELEGSSHST
jgi:hypothetical protein